MANDKVLLRAADVAPLLGVTTGRVYQLLEAGVIPCVREGRSILIPRGAWEAWLAAQNDQALAAAKQARERIDDSCA